MAAVSVNSVILVPNSTAGQKMKQKKIPPLRDLPIPTRKVRTILAYRIVLPIHIIKMGVVYPVKVGDFWEKLPQFQMKSLPISPEVDPETLGAPFQIREQGGGG